MTAEQLLGAALAALIVPLISLLDASALGSTRKSASALEARYSLPFQRQLPLLRQRSLKQKMYTGQPNSTTWCISESATKEHSSARFRTTSEDASTTRESSRSGQREFRSVYRFECVFCLRARKARPLRKTKGFPPSALPPSQKLARRRLPDRHLSSHGLPAASSDKSARFASGLRKARVLSGAFRRMRRFRNSFATIAT